MRLYSFVLNIFVHSYTQQRFSCFKCRKKKSLLVSSSLLALLSTFLLVHKNVWYNVWWYRAEYLSYRLWKIYITVGTPFHLVFKRNIIIWTNRKIHLDNSNRNITSIFIFIFCFFTIYLYETLCYIESCFLQNR